MASLSALRALQFSSASIGATLDSIWPLFLSQCLGFTAMEIGLVASAGPLVSFVASSLVWSNVAVGERKKAALVFMILAGMTCQLSIFGLLQSSPTYLTPYSVAGLASLNAFLSSGIGPAIDSTVLTELGAGRRHLYGSIRAFLTLAISVMSPLTGKLSEYRSEKQFESAWLLFVLANVATLLLSLRVLGRPAPARASKSKATESKDDLSLFQHARQNPHIIALFLLAGIAAASRTATMATLPMYVTKRLGQPASTFGYMITLGTLTELPTFFFDEVVNRHYSATRKLKLSFSMLIARAIIHWAAVQRNAWPVVAAHRLHIIAAAELLQGASFALGWSAVLALISASSPPHLLDKYLNIMSGVSFGLAIGLSQAVTGSSIDGRGIESGFALAAIFATAAMPALQLWHSLYRSGSTHEVAKKSR